LEKHLHIIALNVPYPADYGGVFDLFYKLPALQQQGIKIHLHCFDYGRGNQPELNKYCATVTYYARNKNLSLTLPYIVSSRNNKTLLNNLLLDDHPILMEGIHCTYLLNDTRFNSRKCFVRLHNIEFKYYRYLYKSSTNILKKLYFLFESRLLKAYEKRIANKALFLAVNTADEQFYRNNFGTKNIQTLPLFLEERNVKSLTGKGSYCMFHADLSVPENEKIALWLMDKVFNTIDKQLYVAGKNPSKKIIKKAAAQKLVTLIANPPKPAMDKLIQEAHIIITPSFNATGIKVKLIESLFNGRFVVTNNAAIKGNNLGELCKIAETANQLQKSITKLYTKDFTQAEIDKRSEILLNEFDNVANAEKLVELIWNKETR